jgi:peroxiredoxin
VPRIHFSGKFRADTNSRNNYRCNFDYDWPVYPQGDWNYKGSSEWEFLDTYITAVIDCNGNEIDTSSLLGAELFSNQVQPLAKLVDLDVDYQISTLYGLKLGLRKDGQTLFFGDWSPSFVAHNMWFKMRCVLRGRKPDHDADLAGSSTSRITNISWANVSPALQEFAQCTDCTGDLSIAMSYNYFSQEAFTIGEVIGTIGLAKPLDPLNDGGDRNLETTDPDLTFPPEHQCWNESKDREKTWTLRAPFIIDRPRSKLVVDISNAFPVDIENKPLDLGELFFGILKEDDSVIIFGDQVPYRNWELIRKYGGIIEQHLDGNGMSLLERSQLVIVKQVPKDVQHSVHQVVETLPSLKHDYHQVILLFKELTYYVRPMDHYQSRLEYKSETSSSNVTFLVSKFGIPMSGVTIRIFSANEVIPDKGVVVVQDTAKSVTYGLVTFTFKVNCSIPEKRQYKGDPCKGMTNMKRKIAGHYGRDANDLDIHQLPIDGQVYAFYYCADNDANRPCSIPEKRKDDFVLLCPTIIAFLAFSTMNYKQPYTWVNHVGPIFHQFHHLHHIMSTILNMKNYTEVILPHNVELLRASFTKDFTDPNYMPVTRDLSSTKREMILKWLEKPCYDRHCKLSEIPETPSCLSPSTDIAVPSVSYFSPPRCKKSLIAYSDNPENDETYFHRIIHDEFLKLAESNNIIRPLFGFLGMIVEDDLSVPSVIRYLQQHSIHPTCTLDKLKDQLQIATELEFTTLPLYLTALYSIVQDCNVEAYELIRTIIMQEMLHYAQAANILISVGGKVVLDTPETAPKFPRKGLPGGVLPHLFLTLKKFTLEHVYYTFMGIETPAISFGTDSKFYARYILHTIGQFYMEISTCLSHLGDDIFQGNVKRQLKWPWKVEEAVGKLYIVTDLTSAKKAIRQIIDQGEGAGPLHPETGIPGQFAHFYKFEEIVCQRRLEKSKHGYSYTGSPIPYNPKGVWPMRDNPTKMGVKVNKNCTTEARAFHQVYRNFLRVLQEAVDGYPEKIYDSVALMESLQLHAKKAIWTEYDEIHTCGPIWDYEWD